MEDKELFDFFKSRSQAFNEAPGNALWTKIEAQMLLEPAKPLNEKATLFTKKLFLFIAAVAIIAAVFFMLSQKEVPVVIINKEIKTAPGQVVYENDTVKKKAAQKQYINFAPKKVEKGRTAVAGTAPKVIEDGIISPPAFAKIDSKRLDKDTIKFDLNTVKMTTQTPPGRVIVSVKDKLSESQFRLLTQKIVAEHKNEDGTLIVVKAAGHKLFRQIIKNAELNVAPIHLAIDSVKRFQPIKTSLQDSNVTGGLKAGSITFKVDTLKLNTTRPSKTKNGTNNGKIIKPKKLTETEEILNL